MLESFRSMFEKLHPPVPSPPSQRARERGYPNTELQGTDLSVGDEPTKGLSERTVHRWRPLGTPEELDTMLTSSPL